MNNQVMARNHPTGVETGQRPLKQSEWFDEHFSPTDARSSYVTQLEPGSVFACTLCTRIGFLSMRHFETSGTTPGPFRLCTYDCLCRVAMGFLVMYKRQCIAWEITRAGPPPQLRFMTTAMWKVLLHRYMDLRPELIRFQVKNWTPDQPYHQDTNQRNGHGVPVQVNHLTIMQMYDNIVLTEPHWSRDLVNYFVDDIPNFQQLARQYPPFFSQHLFEQRQQQRFNQKFAAAIHKLQTDRNDRRAALQVLVQNATAQTNQFMNHGGSTVQWLIMLHHDNAASVHYNGYLHNNP